MISKELLSEVLNITAVCDDISNIELTANTITFIEDYWDEDEGSGFYRSHSINIYELAHKCKEWANKQGYKKVYSGIYESTDQGSMYICILDSNDTNCKDFWADTEVEAIFKACEWILTNVKTNSIP